MNFILTDDKSSRKAAASNLQYLHIPYLFSVFKMNSMQNERVTLTRCLCAIFKCFFNEVVLYKTPINYKKRALSMKLLLISCLFLSACSLTPDKTSLKCMPLPVGVILCGV